MLVFKYLLRVFLYFTIAYKNHPVKKKYASSLITVRVGQAIHNFADYQKIEDTCLKICWQLTICGWNPNEC